MYIQLIMWEVIEWQVYVDCYFKECGEEFVMITVVELKVKSAVRTIELNIKICH